MPEGERVEIRIGVNVGDVIEDRGEVYGEDVDLAARLETAAEPGGLCISEDAFRQYRKRGEHDFRDGGVENFKNIEDPVRVYRWRPGAAPAPEPKVEKPLPLPDKPSIAVLPFDNMSGDPEQEYFADGVVESLTATLSRIPSFFVIARNSAFAYKGIAFNVRQIGQELGVAYVLEGSVQRAGQRVRITVQLIETESGSHLWADRYDGNLDDIFDLQDRITEQVAGALQPSIRQAEIDRTRRKRPQDLGAYDYTMRAMRHVWMLERKHADSALELLDQALEIDPDYPLALALAAWCWAQRSVYNWTQDFQAAQSRALDLAERAASVSSDDSLVLAVLGAVHCFARNYGTARVLLERAVMLDPNSAWAISRLGWLEVYTDKPEMAREHFERAIRLSPLDPMKFNNLAGIARTYQVEGMDREAVEGFQRALQERPNALWIHRNLAPALHGAKRENEARRSVEILLEAYPDFTIQKFKSAMVFSQAFLDRIGDQLLELGVPEV